MERPPSARWKFFKKMPSTDGMKTTRAKCKFCKSTVSATTRNMETHYCNCRRVKISIGALLQVNQSSQDTSSPSTGQQSDITGEVDSQNSGAGSSANVSQSSTRGPLLQMVAQKIFNVKKTELNLLFSRAVYETATPFNFFDRPVWHEFFTALNPCWYVPSPFHIGGELLDQTYTEKMQRVIDSIQKSGGGVLGVDGATNRLSKSVSNVIVHSPKPLFIEYIRADLKRETTENVVDKLEDAMTRLDSLTTIKTIFAFVSDSCNGMRDVRRKLVEKELVKWEYGCASHCLHNLSLDIGSRHTFSSLTKKAVYVSKTVKNTGMVRKLFDSICAEKFGKVLSMKLFSPTRWTSCNEMFKRLLRVRPALTLMSHVLINERSDCQIDADFELPARLDECLKDASFWSTLEKCVALLNPISTCLGFLESDTCTMSDTYACFLFVRQFIRGGSLTDEQKQHIDVRLIYRWRRIYSPVHALEFACDPYYNDTRVNFVKMHSDDLMELGNGAFNAQCHKAIRLLPNDDQHFNGLMAEFMRHTLSKDVLLDALKGFRAQLVWGQLQSSYPLLSATLVEVYCAPSSSAAVERNHKTGNAVLTQQRCRLHDLGYQRHVSVAYNGHQLKRELVTNRVDGFDRHLQSLCQQQAPTMISIADEDDDAFDFGDIEEEIIQLDTSIADVDSPEKIPDGVLFIDSDI